MVKSGRHEIRDVPFASRRHPDLPVEALTRAELVARLGRAHFAQPQRPSFRAFLFVWRGTGLHTVDFEEIPLRPGRVVQIRPGQVHQWHMHPPYGGTLVMSRQPDIYEDQWFPGDSAHRDVEGASLRTAQDLVAVLRREQERYSSEEAAFRLLNALFVSLGAVVGRARPQSSAGRLPPAYVAFRSAIERDLGASHTVRGHVQRLAYSERTVDRACRKVAGRAAKAVLSERLTLEAKRLLAHTDATAAEIALALGFAEPTNFHKFFVRSTGQRPREFRRSIRQRAST